MLAGGTLIVAAVYATVIADEEKLPEDLSVHVTVVRVKRPPQARRTLFIDD
jgi:hypothetical protein